LSHVEHLFAGGYLTIVKRYDLINKGGCPKIKLGAHISIYKDKNPFSYDWELLDIRKLTAI